MAYAVEIAEGKVNEIRSKTTGELTNGCSVMPSNAKAGPKTLARLTSPGLMRDTCAAWPRGPVLGVCDAAQRLNSESVRDDWDKASARRDSDPDGAITAARTLLESTTKVILEDRGVSYRDRDDLHALYTAVSKKLGLAPSAHTEQSSKQILGGCHSVVVGLGSPRSKAGDAHGQGRTKLPARGPDTRRSRSTSPDPWPCSRSRRTKPASRHPLSDQGERRRSGLVDLNSACNRATAGRLRADVDVGDDLGRVDPLAVQHTARQLGRVLPADRLEGRSRAVSRVELS